MALSMSNIADAEHAFISSLQIMPRRFTAQILIRKAFTKRSCVSCCWMPSIVASPRQILRVDVTLHEIRKGWLTFDNDGNCGSASTIRKNGGVWSSVVRLLTMIQQLIGNAATDFCSLPPEFDLRDFRFGLRRSSLSLRRLELR